MSRELCRINEQRAQLRNNEESRKQADERADTLLVLEQKHAEREEEHHAKKMKLLDIQIAYWERKTNQEFPSG